MVQRKPSRGDTTLSVSCSDKIARWRQIYCWGLLLKTNYKRGSVFKLFTRGSVPPWMSPEELARSLYRHQQWRESCWHGWVPPLLRARCSPGGRMPPLLWARRVHVGTAIAAGENHADLAPREQVSPVPLARQVVPNCRGAWVQCCRGAGVQGVGFRLGLACCCSVFKRCFSNVRCWMLGIFSYKKNLHNNLNLHFKLTAAPPRNCWASPPPVLSFAFFFNFSCTPSPP